MGVGVLVTNMLQNIFCVKVKQVCNDTRVNKLFLGTLMSRKYLDLQITDNTYAITILRTEIFQSLSAC